MTRYGDKRGVIAGDATGIALAIAKRLVEGGARILLTARTPQERMRLGDELGSSARVVNPAALRTHLEAGGGVDLLFADSVPTTRPLLSHVKDGGAVVLTTPAPSPAAVHDLAAELASRGIRVNAVAPDCIESPGGSAASLPPLGRLGAAEEVARAALFLATDATFTTGARLPVDGGLRRA